MEELLFQILEELKKANAPKLGFGSAPTTMWIFANRKNGGLWYSIEDNQPSLIEASALTAYVKDLKFEKVERRGKETTKLQLFLEGDRPYVIESGHDSHFSKGLMSAIALMSPSDLRQPITILPQPGEDESVLFCRVFVNNKPVMSSYSEETNWRNVARMAVDAVRTATASESLLRAAS